MLGLDARAARAAWTVFFLALAVLLIYLVRHTLLIFICAMLLAYLLSPLVDLVERFGDRQAPRNFSLATVYLLLVTVIMIAGAFIGARMVEQARDLVKTLPQYLGDPESLVEVDVPWWLERYREMFLVSLREKMNTQDILPILGKAGEGVVAVIGNLVFVILVPILSFFFLKDSPEFRRTVLDQFLDARQRGLAEDILADVHVMLAQFMRALAALAAITFAVFWGALWVMRIPYALLLAVGAGVLEFIPVAGPLLAAASIILVTVMTTPDRLIWVIGFLIAYRLFLDYVLSPMLLGAGARLHPAAVIFGVLAGEQIGGIMGMFLSIPVLAILRVIYVRFRKARALEMRPALP